MLKKLNRAGELFSERTKKNEDLSLKKHGSYEAGIQLKTQSSKNYEALTICLRAQLKLLHVDGKAPTHDEITEARTIIDSATLLIDDVDDNID
jgi:hypothetical protein